MSDTNGEPGRYLSPEHLAELRDRSGLSDETVRSADLVTIGDGEQVKQLLGSYLSVRTTRAMGPCLAFPYFNPSGKPMEFTVEDRDAKNYGRNLYIRLKPTKPRKAKNKEDDRKYESPLGATNRAYFPPAVRPVLADPSIPLLLTEGEKKALKASQEGFPTIGLVGVDGWSVKRERDKDGNAIGERQLIPDLAGVAWQGRRVYIAFDSDIDAKPSVQWAEFALAEALGRSGADVKVIRLPPEPDGKKHGLDDFLVGRGADELRKLIEAAQKPARPDGGDGRPEIVISTEAHEVNLHAVAALAAMPDLYQRGGFLSRVIRTDDEPAPDAVVRRSVGSPVVRDLPPPLLREWMTRCARWVRVRETGEREEKVPAHPPEWSVSAVHARAHWPRVRHLEAVVDHPVVLQDGSLLAANGYDRRSRLLVALPGGLTLLAPDRPTRAHAAAAVEIINDAIRDFPFEREEHRAAWFAGLLTPLAWFAFDGPAPLTLIDGNVRGVGKGLLADVIAITLTGRRFPVMSYTPDREDLRKRITSVAMGGERLVLLDNLAGAVGNDVLDAALTTDRWRDRVLGGNKVYDGPLHVAWFATGNNVELRADTARRCSHCRLETAEERPEFKSGFKYQDLRKHLRENRGPLLSAALTILRAWFAAGRPRHSLKPWGSFEGWSGVVREAVVFTGLPDPGETRLALQTAADRDALTMLAMIDALSKADPDRRGMTTAEIIDAARSQEIPAPEWRADLRSAVEELAGKLDGRALGYRFRHFARRNFGGRMLDRATSVSSNGSGRWVVCSAELSGRAKISSASSVSPASPDRSTASPTGDAGDADDVSAHLGTPRPTGSTAPPLAGGSSTTTRPTSGGSRDRPRPARIGAAVPTRRGRAGVGVRPRPAGGVDLCPVGAAHGRPRSNG